MNAMLIGGALMQIPFGWMSDRINRRLMLIATAIGAALGGVLVSEFSQQGFYWALIGVFVFGCFAMPIYSLAMVHASDFAKKEEFVRLSGSMLLLYGMGATIGPVVGAWSMDLFGPAGFFYFTTAVHLIFLALGFIRLSANRAKPSGNITRFGFFPRTSPLVLKFIERKDRKDKKNSKVKVETKS
jgi:MFS family permease